MLAYGMAAAPITPDPAAPNAPDAARLDAYSQSWQLDSSQAGSNGSPAEITDKALNWLVSSHQHLQASDASLTAPAQTAPASIVTPASPTGASARPTESASTLHLLVETYDFAFQENLITNGVYQLTGSVNTILKQQ